MPFLQPKARDELQYFDQEVEGDEVVVVHDPIRGTYYKFNPLQAAMLKKLDGIRTLDQMVELLSEEYEVEIPRHAAERFVTQARKMMLLDIASFNVNEKDAQKKVLKELKKRGFKFRSNTPTDGTRMQRIVSAEAVMFMGGLRHLQAGEPAKALDYFYAVLEFDPKNARTRTLVDAIQTSYVKALSTTSTDFPTFGTFDPTRILRFIDRTLGKLIFTWFAGFALLGLVGVALFYFATTSFSDMAKLDISAPDVILAVVLAFTHMFLHELGHGLACYHYRGKVTEIGFTVFYYLVPFPYCDTSSTYLFDNRRHKVAVALAGNVVTLVITCVIVIFLATTNSDVVIYRAVYLNLLISFLALITNVVPFMKFDGYYALSDLLGTPNLRERSFKLLKSGAAKVLFGVETEEEELDRDTRWLFILFGLLSLFWTLNWMYQAVFSFTAPAVERYQGAGLVVSVGVIGFLMRGTLIRPAKSLIKFLYAKRKDILTIRRSAVMVAVLAIAVLPWMIPYPILVDSDFVLAPKQKRDARAEVAGTVDTVLVHEGDYVRRGQVLGTLVNKDVDLELAVVQSDLEGVDARIAELKNGATSEQLTLARRQTQTAQASEFRDSRQARFAKRLSSDGGGTSQHADSVQATASVTSALADAARWHQAAIEAGSRKEDIDAAEADRSRLTTQLERAKANHELLTIRSPIDGIVTTKHVEDLRSARLDRGAMFVQVEDMSAAFAEIRLPESAPIGELEVGDEIALRADGFPDHEIKCRIERIRATTETSKEEGAGRELTVVTTAFEMTNARSGLRGHARLYGRRRSLAYAKLYLPLQRIGKVSLWVLM